MKRIVATLTILLSLFSSMFSSVYYDWYEDEIPASGHFAQWPISTNSNAPQKIVLTRVGSTNKFNIQIKYSGRTSVSNTIKNVYFSDKTTLNGYHYIFEQQKTDKVEFYTNSDGWLTWETVDGLKGTIKFDYVSGTSNSNYRYNVSLDVTAYTNSDRGDEYAEYANIYGTWSNVPIEVYESNGSTGITINDNIVADSEVPYYASFAWDNLNSNDYSSYDYFNYSQDKFLEIEMYDGSKTKNNYCLLNFWVDESHYSKRSDVNVPNNGTYNSSSDLTVSDYVWYEGSGNVADEGYLYYSVNNVNSCQNNLIFSPYNFWFKTSLSYYGYSSWYYYWLGVPFAKDSYFGSYNDGVTTYFSISKVIVTDKNSKPYIKVYDSANRLAITIGDAAASAVDVTLNSNGGSNDGQVVSATNGSAMPTTLKAGGAIAAPAKTGYSFDGYVANSDGTGKKYYNANLTSANNWDKTVATTIYAKWSPNTNTAYTVKHYKQQLDGTYSATPDETDNLIGTTATNVTPAVKSYTGFTAPATQTVSILADGSRVVTYQYTRNRYTLTWNLAGGTITTAGTAAGDVLYEAPISAPTVERVGYTFAGWDSNDDGTADEVASNMPAAPLTYTAIWNKATTLDLYDNENADYYNAIKTLGNTSLSEIERTYSTVTYHRSAAYTSDNGNARWYTLCLPFNADQSQLAAAGMLTNAKIYEYRYAKGSADENDHVTFHFRAATSIIAGRGYLVKATGDMGPDFEFTGVTLDTDKDTESDVNALKLNSANAYNESGDIAIVGVLRSGTLRNDDRKVMGLANNKIWYPHSSGNPMPAYRAYFYNPSASASSVMPRVRIVVEGEGATELEVVDGELYDAGGDRQAYRAPRKYIRNGVLIIERNGVRYDAQGKRL